MTETITINDSEFDLSDFRACASAIEEVTVHIEKLAHQKQEVEGKLSSSVFDFKNAKKLRKSKKETEEELDHFQHLLKQLEEKYDDSFAKEMVRKAEHEIERVEKQCAELAELCLKEIPAASRKLAIIAAALEKNTQEIYRACSRADKAGLEVPDIQTPMRLILGKDAPPQSWHKKLRLPLLDEAMDVLCYWPLSKMEEGFQENPKIHDDVDEILSSDDIVKAAKALFRRAEKRKVTIRETEKEEHIIRDYSTPMWFERPRGEWAELLAPNPVMACVRQLGDKIQFWLELPQERRMNAFIHLLDFEERERAIEQIPEEERQQYLDHLMDYASNDIFDDEPEPLEATG